jgi:D-alanine transaminase
MNDGRFVDADCHFGRLDHSLPEICLALPMSRAALRHILFETARRIPVREGLLYMQVTYGVPRRDHAFPTKPVPP